MLFDIEIGRYSLEWYWICIVTGLLLSGLFAYKEIKAEAPLESEAVKYAMYLICLYILGSKVMAGVENLIKYGFSNISICHFEGHGRWYGAMFSIAVIFFLFRKKILLKETIFNILMTATCFGLLFGKLGCFLSGHFGCHGSPTSLPWGVSYPYGINLDEQVHPVQLYDSLFYLLLFLLLNLKKSWKPKRGFIFLLAASSYSLLVGFVRWESNILIGLNFAQLIYLAILLILLLTMKSQMISIRKL